MISNKEVNERKQLFERLFDSDDANDFLNSNTFKFSQQIMMLEHKLNIDQKQAAKIANMSLKDFLDFEMGTSINMVKYISVIQALKSKLNYISVENTPIVSFEEDGGSLNQYIVSLLTQNNVIDVYCKIGSTWLNKINDFLPSVNNHQQNAAKYRFAIDSDVDDVSNMVNHVTDIEVNTNQVGGIIIEC